MSKHLLDEVDIANLERESYQKGIAEGKKAHYQTAAVMDAQAEYFSLGRIQTRIEILSKLMIEFTDQEIFTVLQNQHATLVEQIEQDAIDEARAEIEEAAAEAALENYEPEPPDTDWRD